MRPFIYCFLFVSLLTFFGCQSVPMEEQAKLPSMPVTTPFDNNPMARQAYIDSYRDGYRSITQKGSGSIDTLRGPYKLAEEMGWRAGVMDAQRMQGEK
jgi:hypothetical protein